MRKIQFSNVQEKCMCCGKVFSSNFQGTNCTCPAHGYLFAVGTYYYPAVCVR
ncbi:hypothetical protein LBYZC6_13340 [Lacrimispora brassicae]